MAPASAGRARRLLRRLVLATSVPPMLQAYRGIYGLVTWLAVRLFRRYPAIRAVYLTRGSAKGDVLPLVSDIDFLVIHEGLSPRDRAELLSAYGDLARRTMLLDAHIQILDEPWLHRQVEMDDHFRFRFAEGKATWKLLYGRDYCGELAPPEPETVAAGLLAEIKVWWMLFVWRLFGTRKNSDEAIIRNSVCYKAVSESLKAIDSLTRRRLTFDRAGALRAAKEILDPPGRALVERLEAHRRSRFRTEDPALVADTTAFLLGHLDRFYGRAQGLALAHGIGDSGVRIDAPIAEVPGASALLATARDVAGLIERLWGDSFQGAHLVSSVHFNLDELLLLVAVDPGRVPPFALLAAALREHQARSSAVDRRLRLFVWLEHAAFQLDAEDLERSWQSVLWPPSNPDAFALAATPDRCLAGATRGGLADHLWSPLIRDFLLAEETAFGELLERPTIYKLGSRDFLRVFWKTAQLVAMNREVGREEKVVPLTPAAIERALAAQRMTLPPELHSLVGAFDTTPGDPGPDIAELMPLAISYLKEIRA